MKLIERYILRRVGIMFLAVFCAAIGITWTVQVLQRINFLTSSGQSLATAIQFFSLFIPSVIPLVMPFALVIAITQTLSTMNQDSELVVINASGSSAPQMTVSLQAAFNDTPDIAVGSVIGSNIFNILVTLGLSALIIPLRVSRQLVRLDIPAFLRRQAD